MIPSLMPRATRQTVRALACFLLLFLFLWAKKSSAQSSVSTVNLGTNQVTLQITSSTAGTASLTLLQGTNANCGTAAQVAAGQDSTGAPASRFGSLTLATNITGTYTIRNLAQTTAYTACIAVAGTTPVSSSFSTSAPKNLSSAFWTTIGSAGFSAAAASYPSLAFAPDGTPYVAYRDEGNSAKATVMKFDKTNGWTTVGSAGFSVDLVNYTSLAFSPDGTPYVAYGDAGNSGKATVMKFDPANGWTAVGNVGFSSGAASGTSLAFAPDGTPYVAYADQSLSQKTTVMKFDSTNGWTTVGNAGFSSGSGDSPCLVFAPNGAPYVAFIDGGNSNRATVMKFDPTNGWTALGNIGFSPDQIAFPSLAFTPDGTPYVGFEDAATSSRATVMRFDTTNGWTTVGNAGFSASTAAFLSLALSPDGTPYVGYRDWANSSKANVMKYDAVNGWTTAGNSDFSSADISGLSLAFAPDGSPYAAFPDSGSSSKARATRLVLAPTATTEAANNIGSAGATLNGLADPGGVDTTVSFDYGADTSYGTTVSATTGGSLLADSGSAAAAVPISNLQPNTTYHFRITATNGIQTVHGSDATFTTTKITPTIYAWPTASPITYGQTLAASTLTSGAASVAGSFSWNTPSSTPSSGISAFSVTFTPADTNTYSTVSNTVSVTVSKATPTITWATPSSITYGTALSATQLNASSTQPGTFAYAPNTGTVLPAGSQTLMAVFTPTDSTNYTTATTTVSISVAKATPSITWATPSTVTYGTTLSAAQLNASASVSGTFAYSPNAGTILGSGTHTITATFTPSDTANYTAATQNVTLTVNQATPAISWATPSTITYGTALSATQLNATSTVPGVFTYTPAAGTLLGAGSHLLTATFAPSDTTNYISATATVTVMVVQATPAITWPAPASMSYGTALSSTQLNATSTVPGSFSYIPSIGTVLRAGPQTLSTTFTPNDTANYAAATATQTITIAQATPSITWNSPASISYGTPLGSIQLSASSTVPGTFAYTPAVGTILSPGTHTISTTFTPTDATNYTVATQSVAITVGPASPTIQWPAPSSITYGTALGATQLNASSSTAGTFSYTPATGAILDAGTHLLTTTFTPSDATSYTSATTTVSIVVGQAATTTALTSSALNLSSGQSLTLTSTVVSTNGRTPSGFVTFYDGSTALGSESLSNGQAAWTTSNLSAGTHALTARYAGDTNFTSSSSSAASVSVGSYLTTTLLTISDMTPAVGGPVVLTAIVGSSGGTPTGTVTFLDGTAIVGSANLLNGTVAYTTNSLSSGSHNLTAIYAGDSVFASSTSSAMTITVGGIVLSVSAPAGSSTTPTISSGGNANFGVTLNFSGVSLTNAITFSVSGLPTNATANFSPSSITPTAGATSVASTLTISNNKSSAHNKELELLNWQRGILPVSLATLVLPWVARRRAKDWLVWLMIVTASAGLIGLGGCGSSSQTNSSSNGGSTAAGTTTGTVYTVTVTATGGSIQRVTSFSIILQ